MYTLLFPLLYIDIDCICLHCAITTYLIPFLEAYITCDDIVVEIDYCDTWLILLCWRRWWILLLLWSGVGVVCHCVFLFHDWYIPWWWLCHCVDVNSVWALFWYIVLQVVPLCWPQTLLTYITVTFTTVTLFTLLHLLVPTAHIPRLPVLTRCHCYIVVLPVPTLVPYWNYVTLPVLLEALGALLPLTHVAACLCTFMPSCRSRSHTVALLTSFSWSVPFPRVPSPYRSV